MYYEFGILVKYRGERMGAPEPYLEANDSF